DPIAQHEIGRAAECGAAMVSDGGVAKIALQQGRAWDRIGRREVDPDDGAVALLGADPRRGDLAPAAGRAAEIDDPHAGSQQMKALVELDQLESGARAIAEAVRVGDIGIVQLAGEPFGRRRLTPPRLSDPDGERPGAVAAPRTATRLLAHRYSGLPCISSNRMPSRMPRSATRSRPTGQVAQIASRIAQPLSTRSARSRPTQGF